MVLRFRNLDVSPDQPVAEWGFEGMLTAVDRGDLDDWHRIALAVAADPWGDVAQTLLDVLPLADDRGVAHAMEQVVMDLRARREHDERAQVAAELRSLWEASGLTQGEFARRMGTSRTRLNTYLTGKVVPAATVMVRARAVWPDPH